MIRGIDVSHYQGVIDWPHVRASGVGFALLKATQGATGTDPTFHRNLDGCRATGIIPGAYHFFTPTQDARAQADHFLATIGDPAGILLALDCEDGGTLKGSDYCESAIVWLSVVGTAAGRKPLVYCSPSFADERGLGRFLNGFPLWIASYRMRPKMPAGWQGWAIWQYSSGGRVNGIEGDVDMDRFNGDCVALNAIVGR